MTKEFGGLANLTGATFWNSQSALQDVFTKKDWQSYEACLPAGILHTVSNSHAGSSQHVPRVVIVDDALASWGGTSIMPDAPLPDVSTWDGATETHFASTTQSNWTEGMNQSGQTMQSAPVSPAQSQTCPPRWNNISEVDFHPKSFALAPRLAALLDIDQHREDIEERVRYFAEECDYVQGFQIALDAESSWGPQALFSMQDLEDTFPKRPVILMSQSMKQEGQFVGGSSNLRQDQVREAATLGLLSNHCSLMIPLSTWSTTSKTNINAPALSTAHAIAWDCISLPYRLGKTDGAPQGCMSDIGYPSGATDMQSYCDLFSRRATCLAAFSIKAMNAYTPAGGSELTKSGFTSLTPVISPWDEGTSAESVHWRGPKTSLTRLSSASALQKLHDSMINEEFRCVRHQSIFPPSFLLPHGCSPPLLPGLADPDYRHLGREENLEISFLSRLRSTKAFDSLVSNIGKGFSSSIKSIQGRGELERWGLEASSMDVVVEAMNDLLQGSSWMDDSSNSSD